ncbi:MAG TPA: hypothetical protein VEI97_09365, partial [bacterium]|nr:hypothetical protein [bacterium]
MPDAPTPSDPAVPVHPPPPPFLQRRLTVRGILDVLVFLAALSTLAGYLGAFWWPLENLGSFRIQYFWLLLFAGTAYAFARRPKPAIALGLLALVNAFSFVPLYLGGDRASGEPELRVLYANLLATNLDFHEFFELVRTEQPDIIVVVEVSTAWGNHLEALKRDYPYHHVDPLRGYFGIG